MRKSLTACGISATLLLTACGDADGDNAGASSSDVPKVGVILPETDTSPRWESFDRPFLEKALRAAGFEPIIQNAQGDEQKFSTLADQMIAEGVKVLLMTSTSSEVGSAVAAKAKAQGIPTIDYDRINLGGSSEYYVSFDTVTIGELQGEALVEAVGEKSGAQIIQIEGSPTDHQATLFAEGHANILDPLYASGDYVHVGTKFSDKWSNEVAATAFEQMLTGNDGQVDGVLVANDGMGLAVINVLKKYGLNGKVPVTGQDATPEALQAVLRGDMYMTIYKPIDEQAQAAAELAAALANGDTEAADAIATDVMEDPVGERDVKSVLLGAQIITKDTVKVVIDDGFVSAESVCVADLVATCKELGIT